MRRDVVELTDREFTDIVNALREGRGSPQNNARGKDAFGRVAAGIVAILRTRGALDPEESPTTKQLADFFGEWELGADRLKNLKEIAEGFGSRDN
jgi:hypothetical protein